MPPESGGICGRLTYNLPLSYLKNGFRTPQPSVLSIWIVRGTGEEGRHKCNTVFFTGGREDSLPILEPNVRIVERNSQPTMGRRGGETERIEEAENLAELMTSDCKLGASREGSK